MATDKRQGHSLKDRPLPRRLADEWAALLLVLCMAGMMGVYVLFLHGYAFVTEGSAHYPLNLGISVMVATGRGYVEPCGHGVLFEYRNAGKLEEFLLGKRHVLCPDDLPANLPVFKPDSDWMHRHRYLFTFVGLLWRVFGISWAVVDGFRIFLFCVMSVAVYGLFRLGMGRRWSLLAIALMTAFPIMLFFSHNIRDFSKGAFILPAMFLIGWLVARPRRPGELAMSSLVLGLLSGVGIGFRADVLACLPPACFVLLFCRVRKAERGLRPRMTALAVLAAAFLVPGVPILLEFRGTGINAYDATMGFATLYDDNLGVGRASYERLYVNDDSFVSAAISDRAARMQGTALPLTPSAEKRNRFFRDTVLFFPADTLARAYAAVLWVLRLGGFLNLFFVPPCVLVMLGIMVWRDRRTAWMVFLLGLYFCGYVCLQADFRHKFHLSFVPLWVMGFLLHNGTVAARGIWRGAVRGDGAFPTRDWRVRLGGTAMFFAGAGLLLALPLAAARVWQHENIGGMLPLYVNAKLEKVPTECRPLDDWALFRRTVCEPPASGVKPASPHRGSYWVAEFTPTPHRRRLWVQYTNPIRGTVAFSHGLHVHPSPSSDTGTVRYFFPAYEEFQVEDGQWCVFAGLAVPKSEEADFLGLYRVRDTSAFPWLLNLTLPPDLSDFSPHQTLDRLHETLEGAIEARGWFPEHNPLFRLPQIGQPLPNAEEHVAFYRRAVESEPGNAFLRVGLGAALAGAGNRGEALENYLAALNANPRDFLVYRYLDAFYGNEEGAMERLALWQATAAEHPDLFLPHFHLALALEDAGEVQGAVAEYAKALEIHPDDLETLKRAGLLAKGAGMRSEAEHFFGRAHALAPNDPAVTRFFLEREATPGPPDKPGNGGI